MHNLFKRILYIVRPDLRHREVHRAISHPTLSELHFFGSRSPRDGSVHGMWEVTPAGFTHRVTVGFPDGDPTAESLSELEAFLRDLDTFFEQIRPALVSDYAHWVGETLPADWRSAFRLDSVELTGNTVTYVEVEG